MLKLKTLLIFMVTINLVFLLTGCVLVLERTTEPEIKEEIEQESELPDWLLLSHWDTKVFLEIEKDELDVRINIDDAIDKLFTEAEPTPEPSETEKLELEEQPTLKPKPEPQEEKLIDEAENVVEKEEDIDSIWWDLEEWELGPPQRNFTHETRRSD